MAPLRLCRTVTSSRIPLPLLSGIEPSWRQLAHKAHHACPIVLWDRLRRAARSSRHGNDDQCASPMETSHARVRAEWRVDGRRHRSRRRMAWPSTDRPLFTALSDSNSQSMMCCGTLGRGYAMMRDVLRAYSRNSCTRADAAKCTQVLQARARALVYAASTGTHTQCAL